MRENPYTAAHVQMLIHPAGDNRSMAKRTVPTGRTLRHTPDTWPHYQIGSELHRFSNVFGVIPQKTFSLITKWPMTLARGQHVPQEACGTVQGVQSVGRGVSPGFPRPWLKEGVGGNTSANQKHLSTSALGRPRDGTPLLPLLTVSHMSPGPWEPSPHCVFHYQWVVGVCGGVVAIKWGFC